jgi:hypothetical protein
MKKAITIIFLFVSVSCLSQEKKDSIPPAPIQQPFVTLKFTIPALQILYNNLDLSTGNHLEITAIKKYIAEEAKKQTDSTAKK